MPESASGGVCSRGGCLLRGGVSALGGCLLQGVSASGGSAPGGRVCSQGRACLLQGGSALGGVSGPVVGGGIPACTEADTPSPVNRMTNRCKNTTLATTSLR